MTQKDSKKKAVESKDVSGGSGKQLQIVFGRLHNLYNTNTKLWQKIAELEQSNVELRSLIKEVA